MRWAATNTPSEAGATRCLCFLYSSKMPQIFPLARSVPYNGVPPKPYAVLLPAAVVRLASLHSKSIPKDSKAAALSAAGDVLFYVCNSWLRPGPFSLLTLPIPHPLLHKYPVSRGMCTEYCDSLLVKCLGKLKQCSMWILKKCCCSAEQR